MSSLPYPQLTNSHGYLDLIYICIQSPHCVVVNSYKDAQKLRIILYNKARTLKPQLNISILIDKYLESNDDKYYLTIGREGFYFEQYVGKNPISSSKEWDEAFNTDNPISIQKGAHHINLGPKKVDNPFKLLEEMENKFLKEEKE